jgi:hypothetical protein
MADIGTQHRDRRFAIIIDEAHSSQGGRTSQDGHRQNHIAIFAAHIKVTQHIDGSVKYPGLDNHAMGTIFEELVRRFNEENNEDPRRHPRAGAGDGQENESRHQSNGVARRPVLARLSSAVFMSRTAFLVGSNRESRQSFNLHVDERAPVMEALYDGQPLLTARMVLCTPGKS